MGIKNAFHNDSLQLANEKLFEGILTLENVISKKKTITLPRSGESKIKDKYYGFFLEKGREVYFLEDFSGDKSVLDLLPIIVKKKSETDYNKNVFYFINEYDSVKIPAAKAMTYTDLIDTIANFKHTNNPHWVLYKIIMTSAWSDRLNFRVIAERGFGKDSVINNVRDLVGGTANIYGATFAKLEYSLKNQLLIFNELGNLKSDDKYNMQQFLLAIGAFFNKYSKRSRATEDTLEEYDISKQSLGIIYNPPIYYVEKGQEFFDMMFTKAVNSRFIPFYLEGRLDETFDAEFNVAEVVDANMDTYKKCISTLLWYRDNVVENKFLIPDDVAFDDSTRRFERTFLKIADYISEYALGKGEEAEKTYYELVYELYNSYTKYDAIAADAISKSTK